MVKNSIWYALRNKPFSDYCEIRIMIFTQSLIGKIVFNILSLCPTTFTAHWIYYNPVIQINYYNHWLSIQHRNSIRLIIASILLNSTSYVFRNNSLLLLTRQRIMLSNSYIIFTITHWINCIQYLFILTISIIKCVPCSTPWSDRVGGAKQLYCVVLLVVVTVEYVDFQNHTNRTMLWRCVALRACGDVISAKWHFRLAASVQCFAYPIAEICECERIHKLTTATSTTMQSSYCIVWMMLTCCWPKYSDSDLIWCALFIRWYTECTMQTRTNMHPYTQRLTATRGSPKRIRVYAQRQRSTTHLATLVERKACTLNRSITAKRRLWECMFNITKERV